MAIQAYTEADRDEVIALVLHCQNDGTRPYVTVADQPDLLHIRETYIDGGGNFWVAKENGKVAGSIGLMLFENGIGDRAHKFYEKAGFHKVEKEQRLLRYDCPYEDNGFYCLEL